MGYAFLSYSTKNQQAADAMRNLLKKEGIETWMAPGDIPAGSRYAQVINQAIKGCSCFVLILSEDSQNSIWVAKEVERAVNYRKLIIPVQIENVILNDEFELYLSTDQLVAIQKLDEDSGEVRKLIDSVVAAAGRTPGQDQAEKAVAKDKSEICIKLIGVGGCGNNTVSRLYEQRKEKIRYICVNSDQQALLKAQADETLLVRDEDDLRGGKAADLVQGTDLLFITAGMGGNAGTNFSRVIAETARDMGILTVGVFTFPFRFEMSSRRNRAASGLKQIEPVVDTLVVINNEKLLSVADKTTTMQEAFRLADETLKQSILGIADLIANPGIVSIEFEDLKRILRGKGMAYFGTGFASGEDRMAAAAQKAVDNPLIETGISGAGSVLINITGTSGMSVFDVNKAADLVTEAADKGTDILFGTAVDESMGDSVRVVIIASDYKER